MQASDASAVSCAPRALCVQADGRVLPQQWDEGQPNVAITPEHLHARQQPVLQHTSTATAGYTQNAAQLQLHGHLVPGQGREGEDHGVVGVAANLLY